MAGRNRGPPHPHAGFPHEFSRGNSGPMPHPAILEEMRDAQFGRGPRQLLPHPAVMEERLAVQHQEIQGLLGDNQRLAATHVALKQEVAAARHELERMAHAAGSIHSEKDMQLRELYEKSMKMEGDLRATDAMREELLQVRSDCQKLTVSRQELGNQVQALNQDLTRANADLQQVPALKAEIESVKQELQRARAAIEYEKKEHAQNYEHGQAMEKNLISMAREVEKLRAEMANAEKRAHAAASANQGVQSTGGNMLQQYPHSSAGYAGNYVNPDAGYGGNPYPANYGMNPVQGGPDGGAHYGAGPGPGPGPGPRSWTGYDMQQSHGRR